jgi:small GTP-binding protein
MQNRISPRLLVGGLLALIVFVGVSAWLISSVNELHGRFDQQSRTLGLTFLVLVLVVLVAASAFGFRALWRMRAQPTGREQQAPEDVIEAAVEQARHAEDVIRKIGDATIKADLNQELGAIQMGQRHREFHVVVFGTGSAGKTSLINALLGRDVGKTEAVMGTTRVGENHTYRLEGVEGSVFLTDTPGLSEVGTGGGERERLARDLAARSDLLLFVLDHDIVRAEYEPLSALLRQGKRSIVILNKVDRFSDGDRDEILAKLRDRLRGLVAAEDVIAGAAAPRAVPVRVYKPDGSYEIELEAQDPDLNTLRGRISKVLDREGDTLRAGNLLLRAHLLSRKAQEQLMKERDQKAEAVIERFQWITAATSFTNPFPALELLAGGAVQFQMITELANVYGVQLSASDVRMIGTEMIQMLLKLGLVEAATSLIAGIFKSTLVGHAAGGAVQAVSLAYLTHVSGETFAEYFRRGQTWGDGGMQAALIRQFDLTSRAEFLQQFAKQAVQKVSSRILHGGGNKPAARDTANVE